MDQMPWKIVVAVDLGAAAGAPLRVASGKLDEALAGLGLRAEILGGAGSSGNGEAIAFAPTAMDSFSPASVAGLLSKAATTAGTETVSAERIDAALHDPTFQRLESVWRGLALLLEHAGDQVQVEVICTKRETLVDDLREHVFEPAYAGPESPSLILLDFDFTHHASSLSDLRQLSAMAKAAQSPLVAAAPPAFFDLRYLAHVLALPDFLGRLGDAAHAPWVAFQKTEEARWVSLTVNRYLQRAPYSEADGHAETVAESRPDSFLWGRGIWLVGAAAARSVVRHGHGLDLSGAVGGRFDGMPVRSYPTTANQTAPLCTEVSMPDMKAGELSRAAFTPLVGQLRGSTAVIPLAVTVSRLQPGRLTVEGTLAYQITAARLARFAGALLDRLPGGDAKETAVFLQREFAGFLGSLAGDAPEEAVQVQLVTQEAEGQAMTLAQVDIRPAVPLEGKPLAFGFMLPIGSI